MKLASALLGLAALAAAAEHSHPIISIPRAEFDTDPYRCDTTIRGRALGAIARFITPADLPCPMLPRSGGRAIRSGDAMQQRQATHNRHHQSAATRRSHPNKQDVSEEDWGWVSDAGIVKRFNVGLLMVGLLGAGAGAAVA